MEGTGIEPEPVPSNGGRPATGEDCDPAAIGTGLLAECGGDDVVDCVFGGEPGHYDVSLVLGGDAAASTRVLAESRRFMVDETATAAGETHCVSFSVNVRDPEGQPIQDVSAGTPGLNLRLDGSAPSLRAISVTPADPVVLYIAGDSTVCDQDPQFDQPPEGRFTGWGQLLPLFFKRGLSVTNYADSGEGTAAFRTDGGSLWGRIDETLKANDWVLIQVGHNDKTTTASTYRTRIQGMVDAVRAKGAFPVLISPMVRNTGDDLGAQHVYGDLNVREVLTEIATNKTVPFIDLMALSDAWVGELGRSAAQAYFVGTDQTHSNEHGARVFAELVVKGIVEQDLELGSYLR
jgi:lysophospholipase L1-like esterase